MTDKEWRNRFAIRLAQMMYDRGLNGLNLSVLSGLGQPAIWKYLHAKRTPSITSAINLARALDVSLDELFDFGEPIDRYVSVGSEFYDEFRKNTKGGALDSDIFG